MKAVTIVARETAELTELLKAPDWEVPPRKVRGKSLVSLVSPGTELNYNYLAAKETSFPSYPGYAAVMALTHAGEESGFHPGDIVLCMGGHREIIELDADKVFLVPAGLAPEIAGFARLMAVSMSTLNTSAASAPARVLITGLGPVGNLAAQIFARCGYRVTAVDPAPARRETALACGLKDVRASVQEGSPNLENQVALHVECSGHERAVLDGCKCVAKRGEVVLVGVPWSRKVDMQAQELLHAIFHRYVVVRSGWEWEIPMNPQDFKANSLRQNYEAALTWLAEGSIQVGPLLGLYPPAECQKVYQGLLTQSLPTPAAAFDWR